MFSKIGDTICVILRCLGEPLKGLRLSKETEEKASQRDHSIEVLWKMFGTISLLTDPFIDPDCHGSLRIQLRHDLTNPFFTPWSASDIQNIYPVDMSVPGTARGIRDSQRSIDHGPLYPEFEFGDRLERRLGVLMSYLAWFMSQYPRKPKGSALKTISGWRVSSFIELPIDLPDYRLPYPMYKRYWDTGACWFRPSAKSPHIKQLMYSAIQGREDALIREEVLTILGVMIQRLNTDRLEKHVVAPVMLLSFMGQCHGRILVAYLEDDKLVIHKSRLYRFYSYDQESYLLFLSYLAGEEGTEYTTTPFSTRGTHTS